MNENLDRCRVVIRLIAIAMALLMNGVVAFGDEEDGLVLVRVPAALDEYITFAASDVLKMEAAVYDYPGPFEKLPNIELFPVPQGEYDAVLKCFRVLMIDPRPRVRLQEIGSVKVTLKSGRVTHILFYWSGGKGHLRFSINGIRFIAMRSRGYDIDEALTVDALVRKLHEDTRGSK